MRRAAPRAAKPAAALAVCLLSLAAGSCGPSEPLAPPQAYDRYCGRCHGDDGRGDPKAVRLNPKLDLVRSEMVREADRARVRESIVEGRGAMPGFERKLSPEEIEGLTAFTVERFGGETNGDGAAERGGDEQTRDKGGPHGPESIQGGVRAPPVPGREPHPQGPAARP